MIYRINWIISVNVYYVIRYGVDAPLSKLYVYPFIDFKIRSHFLKPDTVNNNNIHTFVISNFLTDFWSLSCHFAPKMRAI